MEIFFYYHPIENNYGDLETTTVTTGLNFNPTLILVNCKITTNDYPFNVLNNGYISNLNTFSYKTYYSGRPDLKLYIDNITKESFNLNLSTTVYTGVQCTNWYAIGVGEDTTLEDSLRDILSNKGVDVTTEDDLASLISKVSDLDIGPVPSWTTGDFWFNGAADMPTPRYRLGSTVYKNSIYCGGGFNEVTNQRVDAFEEYNTRSNTWTTKTNVPCKKETPVMQNVGDGIYYITNDSHYFYDITTDAWSTKTKMPTGRMYTSYGLVGNKIYVINGYSTQPTNINECYDTLTDTWTTKKSSPKVVTEAPSFTWGNTVAYACGLINNSSASIDKNITFYIPETDSYISHLLQSSNNIGFYNQIINNKNNIYIISGKSTNEADVTSTNIVYKFTSPGSTDIYNNYQQLTHIPDAIYEGTSECVNNAIYVIGGRKHYGNQGDKVQCFVCI